MSMYELQSIIHSISRGQRLSESSCNKRFESFASVKVLLENWEFRDDRLGKSLFLES